MNRMEDAKREYDNIPIPEELDSRVRAGIAQGKRRSRRHGAALRTVGTAAACFVVVFAGLNISPTLASAAADVPVVGGLFQVLTIRNYTDTDADRTLTVEQPVLEGGGDFTEAINQEIRQRVEEKTAEGEQLIQDYKAAYFATGGTQEDWDKHDNQVTVTYEVKSQTDTTVSFVVNSNVSIANAYQESVYYNLDVANEKELTLADLLGEDWVDVCNRSIKAQMAAAEDPSVYFDESMGGFSTVDETTSFYINEAGDPVVVFPPYTVAIGALGTVEFEIAK